MCFLFKGVISTVEFKAVLFYFGWVALYLKSILYYCERVNVTIFLLYLVSHPIRPKAPSATSIPAILKSLQDEWVSVWPFEDVAHKKRNKTFCALTHDVFYQLLLHILEFPHPPCSRMLWCFTVSPCGSSYRRPARNYHTPSTNTMPPAESLPDSPKRSLLPEKVCWTNLWVLNSTT